MATSGSPLLIIITTIVTELKSTSNTPAGTHHRNDVRTVARAPGRAWADDRAGSSNIGGASPQTLGCIPACQAPLDVRHFLRLKVIVITIINLYYNFCNYLLLYSQELSYLLTV